MLFDNPVFSGWYTDTVDIYRAGTDTSGNVAVQERRKVNASPVPCRVYAPQKDGPVLTEGAPRDRAAEKLACDLGTDIRTGDELFVVRGGTLGYSNEPERYFAGNPVPYYDPVGGVLTGLEHKEVGLLKDEIVR